MSDALVAAVLAAESRVERVRVVRERVDADGDTLERLLATGERWIDRDPTAAEVLADAAAEAATELAHPETIARATFIRGRAAVMTGDHRRALRLLHTAKRQWLDAGRRLDALRTDHSTIRVLAEQGRHDQARRVGRALLAQLDEIAADHDSAAVDELRGRSQLALGSVAGVIGEYRTALEHYERAQQSLLAAGAHTAAAMATHNRAYVQLALGQVREARTGLVAAAERFTSAGQDYRAAQSLIDLAWAETLSGRPSAALALLDDAGARLEAVDATTDLALVRIAEGDAYRLLNLRPEALTAYRAAIATLRSVGASIHLATALLGLGATLADTEDHDEAQAAITEAASLWSHDGNIPMRALATVEHARVTAALGDASGARARVADALGMVATDAWPVEHFIARLLAADLATTDDETERHLAAAERLEVQHWLPRLRIGLWLARARLARARDDGDRAETLLRRAIDELERLRGLLTHEVLRASFLADKTGPYRELVALLLDRGDEASVQRAFALADRAKTRTLLELVVSDVEARLKATEAGTDAARLAVLRADLAAVYNELLGRGEGDARGAPGTVARQQQLRERARDLESQLSELTRRAVPADVTAQRSPNAAALRASDDAVILAWHVLDDELVAFVSRGAQLTVVRWAADLPTVRSLTARLAAQWQRVRLGPAFVERHAERLVATTGRLLRHLGDELLRRVRPELDAMRTTDPVDRLVIVAHGPLHGVPFHALDDGHGPLLRRWEVTLSSSVGLLGLLDDRRPAQGRPVVVAVDDPSLPGVRAEVSAVGPLLPDARMCVGDAATVAALRDVDRPRVLHLACHGLFRADNPMWSALRLSDGWLTATDALALRLAGSTVILSACESGRQGPLAGGSEAAGLARGFLGAGATRVLMSLWLTDDAAAARLIGRWYELLDDGARAAAALRTAQLELAGERADPFLWAPFVLLGRP